MKGCRNKVFSSQAMSHCHKLRYHVFSASSVKPFFLFLFIPQYQKGDFITKHEEFIWTAFFNKTIPILPLICWHVFLSDLHIHLTSIISRLLLFQIFYIFLRGSHTVNIKMLRMPLFWTFWTFNLPLFLIIYIHLTCTYHVSPAPILSISLSLFFCLFVCLFFCFLFNLSLFLRFKFTWHAPIMTICFSIHLTCACHVDNSLNMSSLTFYFHFTCT